MYRRDHLMDIVDFLAGLAYAAPAVENPRI
jgi:hypothetical protein